MTKTIQTPIFNDTGITHGFFTRDGGVSKGIYEGLNCGPGSGDDEAFIDENRRLVAEKISNRRDTSILTTYQIHGNGTYIVDGPFGDERPKADSMVSNTPGCILGVLTADCAPILFADEKAGVIGAAHAGWKGAMAGVTDSTIESMIELGANRNRIVAAIGPCIAQKSYEVDIDFKSNFLNENDNCYQLFIDGQDDSHFQFDLEGYVYKRLQAANITKIWQSKLDTYDVSNRFFSFRRSTHLGESDYGRQISAIMLK